MINELKIIISKSKDEARRQFRKYKKHAETNTFICTYLFDKLTFVRPINHQHSSNNNKHGIKCSALSESQRNQRSK